MSFAIYIHVLQDTNMKYTSKYVIRESVKSIQAKEAQDNPSNSIFGENTSVQMAQAHSRINHMKVVARRARPGAAAPIVRVHHPSSTWPHLARAVHSMCQEVSCMGAYQKYFTKPTILKLYKKTPSSFHSS
jgi:hypothetical protein